MNFAHAATESTAQVTVNTNAWHAILTASPIVQITLLILVIMSVVSWAIIFSKKRAFAKLEQQDKSFLDEFWSAESLEDIQEKSKNFPQSSAAKVFISGYNELQKVASRVLKAKDDEGPPPSLHGADNIERALYRSIDNEVMQLESRLTVLATTGSTGPFIGLFGTVWGIMGSFQKIGAMKSASLAVVAPGISEALVATAIGLAAAIPAVIAYNHFINRLRRTEIRLNNFSSEYLNIVKRNFFKES